MNMNTTARSAFNAVRRHPARAVAVCVPLLAVSIFYGSTMASATPTPTLAVSAAELNAAPAPDVPLVDNHLTGGRGADVKPTPVKIGWNEDGCDHDYGSPNQCVPWTIPGSTSQAKCAWLKSNGFGPLQVAGTNRQDLTENAQGYVCASGA
jgi:hypothetical protein